MLTLIFCLSLAAVFASVFLLCFSTSMSAANKISISRSIKKMNAYGGVSAIENELSEPFLDRVIVPIMNIFSKIGRRFSPSGFLTNMQQKIELAGLTNKIDVDRLMAYKGFCALAGVMLSTIFIIIKGLSIPQLVLSSCLIIGFLYIPDFWLNSKISNRQKQIRLALPDTLDLLTISVEAGLGFDAALFKVVNNTSGPLSEEFYRLLQEIQLGTTRSEAFRNLSKRTQVSELDSFILAMLQANVFGISIGNVLRVQAKELRIKRRLQAEEMAQKAPVKILFPLIVCIFPAILIVIMGPAIIQIYESILRSF